MLEVDQIAPDFSLKDQAGTQRSLSDARGSWLVLYFYPKDDTPGCTTEACSFRDTLPRFENLDALVWGVSADDEAAHEAFTQKYDLNFPLLVDPDRSMLEAYGTWGERQFAGNRYMGVSRTTYLIDPEGRVARVWVQVDPEVHAQEVAEVLEELQA